MKKTLYLVVFILLSQVSLAATLDSYNTKFTIVGREVVVDMILNFSSSESQDLLFNLPPDAKLVEFYLDDDKLVTDKTRVRIPLTEQTKQLKVSYVAESYLDLAKKNYFTTEIKTPFNASLVDIKLTLPRGAILAKTVEEGASTYPKPDKIETDGQQIILTWTKKDVIKNEQMPIFVVYKTTRNTTVYFLIAFIIVLVVALFLVLRFKRTEKKTVKKTDIDQTGIEKHLKEDEQQIVNLLEKREGSCEQGTLRVITGFSKAGLSRLLKELEDRKIIYKEKRGKKNIVFLRG